MKNVEEILKNYIEKANLKGEQVREVINHRFKGRFEKISKLSKLYSIKDKLWTLWLLYKNNQLPADVKVLVSATLLYFVIPTDLIFDFLPGVGLIDDFIVISAIVRKLSKTISSYEKK